MIMLLSAPGAVLADGACGPESCPPPGCFNSPKTLAAAIADQPDPVPPSLQSICPEPPGDPCHVVSAPAVDPSFPLGANEITVKAALQAGICPYVVHWKVESLMDDGVTWHTRYVQGSFDSVQQQFLEDGTYHVRYGAPGLEANRRHRVSVAYCCRGISPPDVAGCTCWSSPSAPVQTDPYRAGVDLPRTPLDANGVPLFEQEFSDSFRRPPTTAKRDMATGDWLGGDGLGPASVWHDANPASGVGNGAHIGGDGAAFFAVLPKNSAAEYAVAPARPDVFVEALVESGANDTDSFNFDLRARQHVDGGEFYWYMLKVAKRLQNAGSVPDLILGVHPPPASLPSGWTDHGTWAEIERVDLGALDCDGDGTVGDDIPDLRSNGQGEKVWIGLQVTDAAQQPKVELKGYLSWGACSVSDDLLGCENVCLATGADTTEEARDRMIGSSGTTGFDSHEQEYLLYVFRGGSKP